MTPFRSLVAMCLAGAALSGCAAPVDHVGQDAVDSSGRLVAGYSPYVTQMIRQQPEEICSQLGLAASIYTDVRSEGAGISQAKSEVRGMSMIFRTQDAVYLADTVMNKVNLHPKMTGPEAVYYAQQGCTRARG